MLIEISVTIFVVCFISLLYLLVCRKKVVKELRKKSGTLTRIKWTPWAETLAGRGSETRFEVHYKDKDGTPRFAICKTRPFSEVYWRDEE